MAVMWWMPSSFMKLRLPPRARLLLLVRFLLLGGLAGLFVRELTRRGGPPLGSLFDRLPQLLGPLLARLLVVLGHQPFPSRIPLICARRVCALELADFVVSLPAATASLNAGLDFLRPSSMPGWSVWLSIQARRLAALAVSNTPRSRNCLLPNQVCCHQWSDGGWCQLM